MYTVHITVSSVHFRVYSVTVNCKFYCVHCTTYILRFAMYILICTFYSVHCKLYIAIHIIKSKLYILQCTFRLYITHNYVLKSEQIKDIYQKTEITIIDRKYFLLYIYNINKREKKCCETVICACKCLQY